MDPLFFLYIIIVFVLLVGAFFIVYHILRYSLTESLGYFGAMLFGVVFLFLLSVNYFSFQSLDTVSAVPMLTIDSVFENGAPALAPAKNNPW